MKQYLLLSVLLFSCGATDPDPVITPQPGAEKCQTACDAMNNKLTDADGGIGCPEGLPVPAPQDGGTMPCTTDAGVNDCISCTEFCQYQHANGIYWNTTCIAEQIIKCEEIETVCNVQ